MKEGIRNLKYDHAFAIVRIDEFQFSKEPFDDAVHVVKVVVEEAAAKREVERLNRLNEGKGCRYFFQVTRIERQ